MTFKHYKCVTTEERYSVLLNLLVERKNVYLYGGEGKSHMLQRLGLNYGKNPSSGYTVIEYGDDQTFQEPFIMVGVGLDIDKIPKSVNAIVQYVGMWNSETQKYE